MIGEGSCFSVTLPAIAPSAAASALPHAERSPATARRLRLLVVDDDQTNRSAMQAALEAMGHICTSAGGRAEALAAAGSFDAALVDFHLGTEDDGIDLIVALRQKHPGLAAALVTAEREEAVFERARLSAIPILPKPLAALTLEQWLGEWTPVEEPERP